jgi:predicted nucleotidyltransferase
VVECMLSMHNALGFHLQQQNKKILNNINFVAIPRIKKVSEVKKSHSFHSNAYFLSHVLKVRKCLCHSWGISVE